MTNNGRNTDHVCIVCCKKIINKGVECEDTCNRWFHPECVKLSTSEYKKIADGSIKNWQCGRIDCAPPLPDPLQELNNKMTLLLDKFSTLATKDEINQLKDGVSSIQKDINSISDKIKSIEPRLDAAEVKIAQVEMALEGLGANPHPASSADDIIGEINDRNNRARNVIFYRVPEGTGTNLSFLKEHDKSKLTNIFEALDFEASSFSFFRLGKKSGAGPRPLLARFDSQAKALVLLKSFDQGKVKEKDYCLNEVSISRDRTPFERKHLEDLRSELDERTKKGEKNLTIKYVNGTPKIVTPKN